MLQISVFTASDATRRRGGASLVFIGHRLAGKHQDGALLGAVRRHRVHLDRRRRASHSQGPRKSRRYSRRPSEEDHEQCTESASAATGVRADHLDRYGSS